MAERNPIKLSEFELQMICEALEYISSSYAGMSQTPYLFSREDTEEWGLAKRLREDRKKILAAKRKQPKL